MGKRGWFLKAVMSWPALLILLVFSVWVSIEAHDMFLRYRENADALDIVREKEAALLSQYEQLKEVTSRLETPEGTEEEIRSRLPYAKEGEKVILIVEDNRSEKRKGPEDEAPWWHFWRFFQ